jgi:glutamyl-tRNA(Gln) amidotransferase subunit D
MHRVGILGNGLDMTPETAYVKMCWALGQKKSAKKAGKLMETNLIGEITARSALLPE